jgi:hypothetical protein
MKNLFFFILAAAFLSSCSPQLSVYTKELHESLSLSDTELRKVQFYLSREIVLERAYDLEEAQIRDGKITISREKELEQIRIPARTPGIAVFSPDGSRLAISFDAQSDEEFLMFGPNPKMGNRYMLFASEWSRNSGVVTYGGRQYRTQSGAELTNLMVELKALNRQKVESRTVRGRRP